MRLIERDGLLFILAVSGGSADGWSYFGLGHAFVANMTGNTVLLGMGVFQIHGDLLHPLISLGCYAAGVAIASFLTRKVSPTSVWSRAISGMLFLEALLLAGAEAGWIMIHSPATQPPPASSPSLQLLLACVALAMGLQSGAMLQLKIPGIATTYITGTMTNLVDGLVRFATKEKREQSGRKLEFEEQLGLRKLPNLSADRPDW